MSTTPSLSEILTQVKVDHELHTVSCPLCDRMFPIAGETTELHECTAVQSPSPVADAEFTDGETTFSVVIGIGHYARRRGEDLETEKKRVPLVILA